MQQCVFQRNSFHFVIPFRRDQEFFFCFPKTDELLFKSVRLKTNTFCCDLIKKQTRVTMHATYKANLDSVDSFQTFNHRPTTI